MITKEELRRIVYDEVKADIETEAAAENVFQEGYAVGFNDCRYRVVEAIWKRLGGLPVIGGEIGKERRAND